MNKNLENPIKNIEVLYEDDQLVVVNKPAGLVINESLSQSNNVTLQSWLDGIGWIDKPRLTNVIKSDFISRSGIVHRLDKDTSGVIIIARNENSFINLQKQFKDHKVKKTYLALVYDVISGLEIGEEVMINAPIGRNPNHREKFAIVEGGRDSVTEIKLLQMIQSKNGQKYSLVECRPKTGRTHQVRVHLTAMGNSVVGDKLYSGRLRIKKNQHLFSRQFLHASKIEFEHPVTKEILIVEADIPKDLKIVINSISNLRVV